MQVYKPSYLKGHKFLDVVFKLIHSFFFFHSYKIKAISFCMSCNFHGVLLSEVTSVSKIRLVGCPFSLHRRKQQWHQNDEEIIIKSCMRFIYNFFRVVRGDKASVGSKARRYSEGINIHGNMCPWREWRQKAKTQGMYSWINLFVGIWEGWFLVLKKQRRTFDK